jgi:two-component system sensor histidine kinase KdpD
VRKVETQISSRGLTSLKPNRFMACISSNAVTAKNVIRKTARLASYYNSPWILLYVQTPGENNDKIALDKQRFLINNFKLATELGGEIIRIESPHVSKVIMEVAEQRQITTICIGKPHMNLFRVILATNVFNQLLKKLSVSEIDLVILS